MIKRTIKETVREYDADGKVVRETVTETTEDDDTMYFPPFQTYQETVKPWWGEPSCTCTLRIPGWRNAESWRI